jgi:hypothetical protein
MRATVAVVICLLGLIWVASWWSETPVSAPAVEYVYDCPAEDDLAWNSFICADHSGGSTAFFWPGN